MDDSQDRNRISWTTRINVRPASRELLRAMAAGEHISVATLIGLAVESYVTERSTTA